MIERIWTPVLPGIGNTQWHISDPNWLLHMNQLVLRAEYRDKYGFKWGAEWPIAVDAAKDPLVAPNLLRHVWRAFKHNIERRFNQRQEWEYQDLGERARRWKYEHPEIVAGWTPDFD